MLRSGTFSDLAPLALDTHLWFLVVAGASTVTGDQCSECYRQKYSVPPSLWQKVPSGKYGSVSRMFSTSSTGAYLPAEVSTYTTQPSPHQPPSAFSWQWTVQATSTLLARWAGW